MDRGGGLLIAIRSSLSCREIKLKSNNFISTSNFDIDQLIVCLSLNDNNELFIINNYIPPNSSLEYYNTYFENCISILGNLSSTQHIICIGDFNQGNIKWVLDDEDKYLIPFNVISDVEINLIDFFSQFDLTQINSNSNELNRILDLIFVDKEFIIYIEKSDTPIVQNSMHHLALEGTISFYSYMKNHHNTNNLFVPNFKKANFDAMNEYFSFSSWDMYT